MKIPMRMRVSVASEDEVVRRAAKIIYDQPLPIGGTPEVVAMKINLPGVKLGVLAVKAVRSAANDRR